MAVFLNGVRLDSLAALAFLHELPLNDVAEIELLPPVDAMTRFGHAGEDGALLITMRAGSQFPGGFPRRPGPRLGFGLTAGRYDPEGGADSWYPAIGARIVYNLAPITAVKVEASRVRFERWVLCRTNEACDVRRMSIPVVYLAGGVRLQPPGRDFQPYLGVAFGIALREEDAWRSARSVDVGMRVGIFRRVAVELEHRWRADRTSFGKEDAAELQLAAMLVF